MCAPPDCAERLAEVGVPLVPVGRPVRSLVHRATPPSAADVPRRAAELIAAQFDTVAAAAEGCDALVASGLMPAAAGARSVAEKLGIRYVYVSFCPIFLPSPHHPPFPLPGQPLPPDVTDNRVLWDLDAQSYERAVRRGAQHPPGGDRPAAGGQRPRPTSSPTARGWRRTRSWRPWQEPADLDVVQTGAWILPDERPLPAELEAFLDAGAPPVYVGFGSMRAPKDIARVAIEAIRAQGRRVLVGRGWAGPGPDRRPGRLLRRRRGQPAGAVRPGGRRRAPRRRGHHDDGRPGRRAPGGGTPERRTSRTGPAGWPTWASARRTTVRLRPSSPCRPRSARP